MYEIESGEVYGYDTTCGQFVPLGELRTGGKPAPSRVLDVRSGDALFRAHVKLDVPQLEAK